MVVGEEGIGPELIGVRCGGKNGGFGRKRRRQGRWRSPVDEEGDCVRGFEHHGLEHIVMHMAREVAHLDGGTARAASAGLAVGSRASCSRAQWRGAKGGMVGVAR